ncbi:ATP-binding protein [Deferribacter abyssi]|uniref:ATP-binding protein n=1 Tax=Deferribacter abyssi TaxID=213806 RepID=UPI003C20314C
MTASYFIGKLNNKSVFWIPDNCHNPHLIICGSSGTGKTYTIKNIIKTFSKHKITFTIIDKHGDIDVEIPEYQLKYGSDVGINPLALNNHIDSGGPKINALSFIALLNELSGKHKIGPDQQNMLYNCIMDLYKANGIYQDNPQTWRKDKYPDLNDLIRFLNHKYKKVLIGDSDNKEIETLYNLFKEKKKLERYEKEKLKNGDVDLKIKETIDNLVKKYREYLEKGILNDKDFLIYTNPKSLISLKNRIQNINNTGIFIKNEIPLISSRINIKMLDDEQKKLVTFYVINRLFSLFLKRDYSKTVKHYIVIDEASFYLEVLKIAQEIIKVVQEGRKFGLGVILSTQNPLHFHSDILLNSATKIIFALDPIIYKNVSKSFGLDEKFLKYLVPRKNCLFSTKNIGNGAFYIVKRD